MTFYEDRAAFGAKFLDKELPGWAERIDLDLFDMVDGECCVLGQLAPQILGDGYDDGGPYFDSVQALRLGEDGRPNEYTLGFFLRSYPHKRLSWDALTKAWKNEITARINIEESK